MEYEITEFSSGLPVILSPAPNTPRIALAITFDGGIRREPAPGVAKLANRLLLKGTQQRNAEALAHELDERGIDLHELALNDCAMLVAVFLNRELPVVLDILQDVVFHSTFTDFGKELTKLDGEVRSTLDLPSELAQDLMIRTLFEGHPYGNTGTRLLESIEQLNEDGTRQWYGEGLNARLMNVALVGDFDANEILPRLRDTFAELPERASTPSLPPVQNISRDRIVTQARPDAQQAQIYQGWYAPKVGLPEQAAMAVMNTILGGAGLSSRLFTELRDKQGLAYSVRSQYVPMRETGEFVISIGTSPENIERARNGFAEQLARLQQEPISLEELQNAKGRWRGSFVLSHETNNQRCLDLAINQINGLGPDYSEVLLQRIEGVTVADVQAAAQRITGPSVTAIVAREEALPPAV